MHLSSPKLFFFAKEAYSLKRNRLYTLSVMIVCSFCSWRLCDLRGSGRVRSRCPSSRLESRCLAIWDLLLFLKLHDIWYRSIFMSEYFECFCIFWGSLLILTPWSIEIIHTHCNFSVLQFFYLNEGKDGFSSLRVLDVERQILEHRPFLYFLSLRHNLNKFFSFSELFTDTQSINFCFGLHKGVNTSMCLV